MRVYYAGNPRANITLTVAPAADPAGVKGGVIGAWLNDDGSPKNIEIAFAHGSAELPDELAKYLIDAKLARKTALIIPQGVAA
jgi:hypothetical protein